MRRRGVVSAATVALFLALAPRAVSVTFCVPGGSGCSAERTIAAALAADAANGTSNTILLGSRTYSEDDLSYSGSGALTPKGGNNARA